MATTPAAARAHADRADAAAPTVRGLIVFGVVVAFAVACLLWALYLARQALLLIYVSALLATGLGPLVRMLERRGIVRGARPLPRWAAVTVVYLVSGVVGLAVVLTIFPTLIGQM